MTLRFTHRCSGNTAILEDAVAQTSTIPHQDPYTSYLGERNHHASRQIREAIGEQTLALMGAHELRYAHDASVPDLSFAVRGSIRCSHLRVEMADDDLFHVTASRLEKRGAFTPDALRTIDQRHDVPAQFLHGVMERMTDIRLPAA